MTNRYIGIDPGSKGAVAIIDDNNCVQLIVDLSPDVDTYRHLIDSLTDHWNDTYVAVEDVCGRPGQSCQANTTFMKLAGMAELLGQCIGEMTKVKPQVWKKHFGLIFHKGISKTDKKHASVDVARTMFPSVADQLLLSKDGRAEALLIAKWMKEKVRDEQ